MKFLKIFAVLGLVNGAVLAESDIDPEALAKRSLSQLANAEAISVDGAVSEEAVLSQGLKIRSHREGSILLSRSKGFMFSRSGALINQTVSYDGSTVYGVGHTSQIFVSVPVSGTNDEVMDILTSEAGAYLPGRDMFYADVAEELLAEVSESHYLGLAPINGSACHYVVMRGPDVDWHLWMNEQDLLPCKYMITSKWMAGAPEFEITFSNWNLNPAISDSSFTMSAPEGYARAKFVDMQPEY